MHTYRVIVSEEILSTYDEVRIKASSEGEAHEIAEGMRTRGELTPGAGTETRNVFMYVLKMETIQ